MHDTVVDRRPGERGFALVLAILSLMLLTFLGLTLATTTSTELQIATNYRWSQQALYNAEAGIESARILLSRSATRQPVEQVADHPARGANERRGYPRPGSRAPRPRSPRAPDATTTAATATRGAAWATASS